MLKEYKEKLKMLPEADRASMLLGRISSAELRGAMSPDKKYFYLWDDDFNTTILESFFTRTGIIEIEQAPQNLGNLGLPRKIKVGYRETWGTPDGHAAVTFKNWIKLNEPSMSALVKHIGAERMFIQNSQWFYEQRKFQKLVEELQSRIDLVKIEHAYQAYLLGQKIADGSASTKELSNFTNEAAASIVAYVKNFCEAKGVEISDISERIDFTFGEMK